jgi:hypothetical protein
MRVCVCDVFYWKVVDSGDSSVCRCKDWLSVFVLWVPMRACQCVCGVYGGGYAWWLKFLTMQYPPPPLLGLAQVALVSTLKGERAHGHA